MYTYIMVDNYVIGLCSLLAMAFITGVVWGHSIALSLVDELNPIT